MCNKLEIYSLFLYFKVKCIKNLCKNYFTTISNEVPLSDHNVKKKTNTYLIYVRAS